MNILFLTIGRINNLTERDIYSDLMSKFRDEGHNVVIVSPSERRYSQPTELLENNGVKILKVRTLNLQKTNLIEKGIGTMLLEYQVLMAVKKHLPGIVFDLVLYSTPPITFTKVVTYFKLRDRAKTYLLLKDIFPQNAVDLNLIKENGLIHKYFRLKEHKLYLVSDYIGCLSQANVKFLLKHNQFINKEIVEVNPNSIRSDSKVIDEKEKAYFRKKFSIPLNKTVFVYGGNLGKPQGLDFLLDVIYACRDIENAFFTIVGDGTEYPKIEKWFNDNNPPNAMLIPHLPRNEFDNLVQSCNVGLIFLDKRFTIPNYPSRLLSYLEFKLPVISATDTSTDIGRVAEDNGYGFHCVNGDLELMKSRIILLASDQKKISEMGEKGYQYLLSNFTVDRSYSIIMKHFE